MLSSELVAIFLLLLGHRILMYGALINSSFFVKLSFSILGSVFVIFSIFSNPKVLVIFPLLLYLASNKLSIKQLLANIAISLFSFLIIIQFAPFISYLELIFKIPKGDYFSSIPLFYSDCNSASLSCFNSVRFSLISVAVKTVIIPATIIILILKSSMVDSKVILFSILYIGGYALYVFMVGRPSGQYFLLIIPVLIWYLSLYSFKVIKIISVLVLMLSIENVTTKDSVIVENENLVFNFKFNNDNYYYFGRGEASEFYYVNGVTPCVKNFANWFVYPLLVFDKTVDVNKFKNEFIDDHVEDVYNCKPSYIVVSLLPFSTATPKWLENFSNKYYKKVFSNSDYVVYEFIKTS